MDALLRCIPESLLCMEVKRMKKLSLDVFLRLRKLIHRNARPLDYTMWRYLFEDGSGDAFLLVLSSY